MSDLISRSELIKELNKYCGNQRYLVSENIREIINNQPTAYSVDKVVEKLEELRKKDVCDYLYCDVCAYTDKCSGVTDQSNNLKWDKAIEIVNQGGVSNDMCEWKYNDSEYYFESSCKHLHIFMSDGPKENEYRFCPYCGKKIKEMESD